MAIKASRVSRINAPITAEERCSMCSGDDSLVASGAAVSDFRFAEMRSRKSFESSEVSGVPARMGYQMSRKAMLMC